MADTGPAGPQSTLRLRPFPGMRFNADVVGDIGAVTSPPYDVMDRPMIEALLDENPRNIVRLILPRMVSDPVTGDDPYHRAAKLMRRWRSKRVLTTDTDCALYIYEYGDGDVHVCGIVGALELPAADAGTVLPHEDVIAGIVADRLAMMTASEANLEPILLVYDGAGGTAELIARHRAEPPLVDVEAGDGTAHRLWAITASEDLRHVRAHLSGQQALIADGHHRYATYQQLRHRHRSIGDGDGPWDRGLALLIDQSQWPLRLGAIHRSVSELDLAELTAPPGCELGELEQVGGSLPDSLDRRGRLLLTDGRRTRWLILPHGGHAVSDAELLHERVLPAWSVGEERIGYHHTVDQTVRNARQDDGIAILMCPTTVDEVMAVARAGKIMPRKSTSFGPKPRMGVVMRAFADEA